MKSKLANSFYKNLMLHQQIFKNILTMLSCLKMNGFASKLPRCQIDVFFFPASIEVREIPSGWQSSLLYSIRQMLKSVLAKTYNMCPPVAFVISFS